MSEQQPSETPQASEADGFANWCLNSSHLSGETKRTVDALLKVAGTTDCNQADKHLLTRTELHLNNNQISDLKPLSALTNLTELHLNNNQISDLKPLSALTNLTELHLNNNQITDLEPLSALTNLTELDVDLSMYIDKQEAPVM